MYLIAVQFESGHPRMAGKSGNTQLFTRGAWRIVACFKNSFAELDAFPVTWFLEPDLLYIPCVSRNPPRKGTLVNPRKALATFLAMRREVRARHVPQFLLKAAA